MKKYILLILLFVIISCQNNSINNNLELPSEISQFATSATASDAYGGVQGENRDDQSPFAATGSPDIAECGDDPKAWVIGSDDDGEHFLELNYDQEVFVSKVKVFETFGPGALIKLEAYDGTNFQILWEGVDTNSECPGIFEFVFSEALKDNTTRSMTCFKTNKLKITLNTDIKGWNEIDAVELIGFEKRWFVHNNSVNFE